MSLFTDTQQLVNEAGAVQFWSNQHVFNHLNAALLRAQVRYKNWQQTAQALAIPTGSDLVTLPTAIMLPQYILDSNQQDIFPTTHALLQDWDQYWRNTPPGVPHWFVLWDAAHIRVFPRADADYTYTIKGLPWPDEITTTTQDVAGDALMRTAITYRAAAGLLKFTQAELAQQYLLQAGMYEKQFARTNFNRGGANTMRLRPGVGWQVAQAGDLIVGGRYR